MSKSNVLLEAAIAEYEGQRKKAIAHLAIICQRPVGIGEHTDLVDEINKWTVALSEAEDKIATIRKNYLEIMTPING